VTATDLVRLLPRQFGLALEIWLVMHENLPAGPAFALERRR